METFGAESKSNRSKMSDRLKDLYKLVNKADNALGYQKTFHAREVNEHS